MTRPRFSSSLLPAAVALLSLTAGGDTRAQNAGAPSRAAASCAAMARTTRANVVAAARAAGGASVEAPGGDGPGSPGFCATPGEGGWALTADQLTVRRRADRGDILTGRWGLAFISADGVVHPARAPWLAGALGERFGDDGGGDVYVRLHARDLDGDGVPEALVQRSAYRVGGGDESALRVVSWRGGTASPYAAAAGFEDAAEASDADHDGALDLLWLARFAPADGVCGWGAGRVALVAIAHNDGRGAFSRDDDTARAWLRAQCPGPPTRLIAPEGGDSDSPSLRVEDTLRRVACARVWGASADEVARRLEAERPPPDEPCLAAGVLAAFARGLRPWAALSPAPAPVVAAAPPSAVARAPAGPVAPPPPPPRVTARSLPAPLAAPCARVERAHAGWLARARQELARHDSDPASLGDLFDDVAPGSGCVAAPGGAWALPLDALRHDPVHSIAAAWSIRFFDARGTASSRREQPDLDRWFAEVRGVFDFDGDGRGEAIVRPTVWGTDPPERVHRWSVYTARGGAVVPYAPAVAVAPFSSIADVDRDGRPDLLDEETFASPSACGQGNGTFYGPTLVAHARADGTFSRDDDAARAFVMAQCPSPPTHLAAIDGGDDFARAYVDVACARLWGASAESVVLSLVAALRRPGSHLTDTCESFRLLADVALRHPPLVLTARRGAPAAAGRAP